MKPLVIAVASPKGGVGKTTTCVQALVWMLSKGIRAAAIDTDPMHNLHGFNNDRNDAISIAGYDDLPIITVEPLEASYHHDSTRAAELDAKKLDQTIKRLSKSYNVIIIDVPGFDSMFMQQAHLQAHIVLTPVDIESSSSINVLMGHYKPSIDEWRQFQKLMNIEPFKWIVAPTRVPLIEGKPLEAYRMVLEDLDTFQDQANYTLAPIIPFSRGYGRAMGAGLALMEADSLWLSNSLNGVEVYDKQAHLNQLDSLMTLLMSPAKEKFNRVA